MQMLYETKTPPTAIISVFFLDIWKYNGNFAVVNTSFKERFQMRIKREDIPKDIPFYTIGRLIGAEDLKVSNSRMRSLTITLAMQN